MAAVSVEVAAIAAAVVVEAVVADCGTLGYAVSKVCYSKSFVEQAGVPLLCGSAKCCVDCKIIFLNECLYV